MTDLFDLTGKVAVVTGGSRGMGREMSLAFAQHGAAVVASRKIDACEDLAEEVRDTTGGGRFLSHVMLGIGTSAMPCRHCLRRVWALRHIGQQRRSFTFVSVAVRSNRRPLHQSNGCEPQRTFPSLRRVR